MAGGGRGAATRCRGTLASALVRVVCSAAVAWSVCGSVTLPAICLDSCYRLRRLHHHAVRQTNARRRECIHDGPRYLCVPHWLPYQRASVLRGDPSSLMKGWPAFRPHTALR